MSRLILITGVTKGLGRAMAMGFAKEGHTVVGCGRDSTALSALGKALGTPHDFQAVDISVNRSVSDWIEHVLAQHGTPDLVLNNAAIINANAPLWEISAPEFDRVIDVNIKGVQNVIRHVVPPMIERGSGVIVNFSSGWGRSTSPDVAPY